MKKVRRGTLLVIGDRPKGVSYRAKRKSVNQFSCDLGSAGLRVGLGSVRAGNHHSFPLPHSLSRDRRKSLLKEREVCIYGRLRVKS